MKTRNLILFALALTSVMVFTQLGVIAQGDSMGGPCVIVPGGSCPSCPGAVTGSSCHAGATDCGAGWLDCCNWATRQMQYGQCDGIMDNTGCDCCA